MTNATKKWLHDVLLACRAIAGFTAGVEFSDYERNLEKRSAVERQLEIIGEALGKAAATDSTLAERLSDLPRMIGMRNRIIHGYDDVDDAIVWDVVTSRVTGLEAAVALLLAAEEGKEDGPVC